MRHLTPMKLIGYVKDFDYEISIEQAKEILELLENAFGTFTSDEIQMATDRVVYGDKSKYIDYF